VSTTTYLDHAATTPMRPEAVEAMMPYFSGQFANPSGSHRFARRARQVVDEARDELAMLLGCLPGEVIFTSGGTESDNTAIFGVLDRQGGTVLCAAAEHHAVLHAAEQRRGVVVGNDGTGHLDVDQLISALTADTAGDVRIVSVMAVNNEVGTITDLAEVARVVRQYAPQAVLHTDAVQAPCWLDLRSITPHVDLLSLSAHKFGGPKGIGVLMARQGVAFDPLLVGGGQERERRSGTHNVPGIVGITAALRVTDQTRAAENIRIAALRDRLVANVVGSVTDAHETVPAAHKVAGSAHLMIAGIENEALLFLLDESDVYASAASACAAGAMEPSHVLAAMGVPTHLARGAVRLTLGTTTTKADVDRGAEVLIAAVHRLRRTAPQTAGRSL
jgi:cysteine desulfurase